MAPGRATAAPTTIPTIIDVSIYFSFITLVFFLIAIQASAYVTSNQEKSRHQNKDK
jgi:hypothetical protein